MSEKPTIVRYSLSEIEAKRERGEDQTRADAPEAESLGEESGNKRESSCRAARLPYICGSTATSLIGSRHTAKGI